MSKAGFSFPLVRGACVQGARPGDSLEPAWPGPTGRHHLGRPQAETQHLGREGPDGGTSLTAAPPHQQRDVGPTRAPALAPPPSRHVCLTAEGRRRGLQCGSKSNRHRST